MEVFPSANKLKGRVEPATQYQVQFGNSRGVTKEQCLAFSWGTIPHTER